MQTRSHESIPRPSKAPAEPDGPWPVVADCSVVDVRTREDEADDVGDEENVDATTTVVSLDENGFDDLDGGDDDDGGLDRGNGGDGRDGENGAAGLGYPPRQPELSDERRDKVVVLVVAALTASIVLLIGGVLLAGALGWIQPACGGVLVTHTATCRQVTQSYETLSQSPTTDWSRYRLDTPAGKAPVAP